MDRAPFWLRLEAAAHGIVAPAAFALAALAFPALAGGCVARPTEMTEPEDGARPPPTPAELFDALESSLVSACAGCHEAGGVASAPFLDGPDRYASVKAWPGLVVPDPASSLLLTYPRQGSGHPGRNLDAPALKGELLPRVEAWLQAEADASKEPHPMLPPFAPVMGFNAVFLDSLGEPFDAIALTFEAAELGPGVLSLSRLEVHPTARAGVRVTHPLFSVIAHGSIDPDPVDSFSELHQTFEVGEPAPLGCGTLILTEWVVGAEIEIAFEAIEVELAAAP